MTLAERHRWCMSKILETFAPELSTEVVNSFMRQETNLQKFNQFFRGEGPGRIFLLFQPELQDGEVIIFKIFCVCCRTNIFHRTGQKIQVQSNYQFLMVIMVL